MKAIWKRTNLTGADFDKLYQLAIRDRARDNIKKALKKAGQEMNRKFGDLLEKGYKTILTNVSSGTKKSIKEFVRDKFKFGLKRLQEAMQSVIGDSMKEYFDNLVGKRFG